MNDDHEKQTGDTEKFKSLEDAWLVLSFPKNRAEYDRLLRQPTC